MALHDSPAKSVTCLTKGVAIALGVRIGVCYLTSILLLGQISQTQVLRVKHGQLPEIPYLTHLFKMNFP